jgi:hypothetical protein
MTCGVTAAALEMAADLCNVSEVDVFGAMLFLYTGKLNVTRVLMQLKMKRGWGERNAPDRIRRTLQALADGLHPDLFREAIDNQPSLSPFLPANIKIAIDTVPIYVDADEFTFQPKYAEDVYKVLVATTFSGYVVYVSQLFSGTSADNNILQTCGIETLIAEHQTQVLADGAFSAPYIFKPPTKPAIYPKYRERGQTDEQYWEAAEEKLREVQRHSHFRSRVEHVFGRARMGRFAAFKNWQGRSKHNLRNAVVAAVGMLNLEVYCRHGWKGCYPPLDSVEVQRLSNEHSRASARYPRPPRAPPQKQVKKKKPRRTAVAAAAAAAAVPAGGQFYLLALDKIASKYRVK